MISWLVGLAFYVHIEFLFLMWCQKRLATHLKTDIDAQENTWQRILFRNFWPKFSYHVFECAEGFSDAMILTLAISFHASVHSIYMLLLYSPQSCSSSARAARLISSAHHYCYLTDIKVHSVMSFIKRKSLSFKVDPL